MGEADGGETPCPPRHNSCGKLACEGACTSGTSALPDTLPSRASSLPQVRGYSQNLWEQACLRRGRYIRHICFARYTAFASKLAPTSSRTFTKSVQASLLAKAVVQLQRCSGCSCLFASKLAPTGIRFFRHHGLPYQAYAYGPSQYRPCIPSFFLSFVGNRCSSLLSL